MSYYNSAVSYVDVGACRLPRHQLHLLWILRCSSFFVTNWCIPSQGNPGSSASRLEDRRRALTSTAALAVLGSSHRFLVLRGLQTTWLIQNVPNRAVWILFFGHPSLFPINSYSYLAQPKLPGTRISGQLFAPLQQRSLQEQGFPAATAEYATQHDAAMLHCLATPRRHALRPSLCTLEAGASGQQAATGTLLAGLLVWTLFRSFAPAPSASLLQALRAPAAGRMSSVLAASSGLSAQRRRARRITSPAGRKPFRACAPVATNPLTARR